MNVLLITFVVLCCIATGGSRLTAASNWPFEGPNFLTRMEGLSSHHARQYRSHEGPKSQQKVLKSPSGRAEAVIDPAGGTVTVTSKSGGSSSSSQQSLGGNGQIGINGETLIIHGDSAHWH